MFQIYQNIPVFRLVKRNGIYEILNFFVNQKVIQV